MLGQAAREAVGLGGTVVGLLAGSVTWILSFAVLSLVALAWGWPSDDELRRRERGGVSRRS